MKRKKVWIGILSILGIIVAVCFYIAFSVKANLLNYNEITFSCGKDDDAVYYEFVSEDGMDINLNSFVAKNQRDAEGKVIASKMYVWVGRQFDSTDEETTNYFRENLNSAESIVEWIFIFRDKTIAVLNGEIL